MVKKPDSKQKVWLVLLALVFLILGFMLASFYYQKNLKGQVTLPNNKSNNVVVDQDETACAKDSDCGINTCGGCKPLNKRYLKSGDTTCFIACGNVKCINKQCQVVE